MRWPIRSDGSESAIISGRSDPKVRRASERNRRVRIMRLRVDNSALASHNQRGERRRRPPGDTDFKLEKAASV
jgi:hypothetical protein